MDLKEFQVALLALILFSTLLIFLFVFISFVEEDTLMIDSQEKTYSPGYHLLNPLEKYQRISLSGEIEYSSEIFIKYHVSREEALELKEKIAEEIRKETIIEAKKIKDMIIIRVIQTPSRINPNHLKIVTEINPSFFIKKRGVIFAS